MQEKKKQYMTGNRIQGEFDRFIKKSIPFVVRNVLRDYVRHNKRLYEVSIDDIDDIAGPEWIPDSEKIPVSLGSTVIMFCDEKKAEGFQKLKQRHREVIEKAFVFDMPTAAIAELMDLEEKSVKTYISEAKGILRKYLG